MLLLAVALCSAGAPGAWAAPILTTVGSPFQTGNAPASVAFGPERVPVGARLLASANVLDDSVSMFSVSAVGVLTAVGSPAPTGMRPTSVTFSPSGRLLAVSNSASNSVSMFSVSGEGQLTPVGAPATTGERPGSVAFSSDGLLLATVNHATDPDSGDGGSVSVFSVSAVGVLHAVGPPVVIEEGPASLAFSPTRMLLATANAGSDSVSVFAVTTGGELTRIGEPIPAGNSPAFVAFSPDGGLLATASDSSVRPSPGASIRMFSVSTAGALTPSGAPHPTPTGSASLAFAPGGRFLAATSLDDRVTVLSVSSAGALAPVGSPAQTGMGPAGVAFSPDGRLLATANMDDDSLSSFMVTAGGALIGVGAPAPTGAGPCSLQFSPVGGLLATGDGGGEASIGGTVSIFSISVDGGPTALGGAPFLNGRPCSVGFSPDGELLATANGVFGLSVFAVDPSGGLTAADSPPVAGQGSTDAVAFSSGGLLATASASEHSVSVFSVAADGALTPVGSAATDFAPESVAFRPDGELLVTANRLGDSLSVFSVSAGGALTPVGSPTPTGGSPKSLAFSPNGDLLLVTDDSAVRVFSVSAAGVLTAVGSPTPLLFPGNAATAAFSPSGGLVAVADLVSLVMFVVSASGELTPAGTTPIQRASAVAFSPDGRLVATTAVEASTVSVYSVAAPTLATTITSAPPHMSSSTTADFEFEPSYLAIMQCALDTAPFGPCSTSESHSHTLLPEGAHTFTVRATDLLGNVEPSPASWSWTVDHTPPVAAGLTQPASGASDLRSSPVYAWLPTTDSLTGVDRYELWVDGLLSRQVASGSCGATCSATSADPLADGEHVWEIRAVDGAGNVAVSVSRSFSVDAAPPGPFALNVPVDGAAIASRRPALSWQPAVDGGIGLAAYDVVLDDQVVAGGLPPSATSFTAAGDLADGVHRWRVVARDAYGNERSSATQNFIVDTTAPVAALTAAPNPALAGRSITFDAGASTDSGSGIARVEWDLDGDGSFETDTGAVRTAARSYAEPGTYAVLVRVSDRVGLSATARASQRVTATGSAGPLGVSIDNGARYTRSPRVTITATWPLFASQMLVSNDGGFATAATLPLAKHTAWTLDSSGAERSSRLVYVRFQRGLTTSETYIDDIILDESRPSVTLARVALSRRAAAPRLAIRARDRGLAGVASVQVTNNRRKPLAKYQPYRATLTLVNQPGYRRLTVRKQLYVRVRDRAGNVSAWRTVKRTR